MLAAALRLGLTSFGGPIAHIGYFRREYVERRGWLDEAAFADLVALSQLLPGPSSSQLGIAIGSRRAGMLGGLVAWLGFTLPSAIALTLLGLFAASTDLSGAGWIHGLKLAAVAVVGLRSQIAPTPETCRAIHSPIMIASRPAAMVAILRTSRAT